jgi:hypothetical protein
MQTSPIVFVIPVLFVLGFIGSFAFWSYSIENRQAKRFERSMGWPEVHGVVQKSFAARMHITVVYEYVAEGRHYIGEHKIVFPSLMLARGSQGVAIAKDVRKEMANFSPGQRVVIRYNPKDPAESVLYYSGELQKKDPAERASIAPDFRTLG